jgi:hypothetical protein
VLGLSLAVGGVGGWQDADVFAKRGIYVETDQGVSEMRQYAEARPLVDSSFQPASGASQQAQGASDGRSQPSATGVMRAYRYVFPNSLQAPRAKVILSFVINMPGYRSDGLVAGSQLLFVVGREVDEGRASNYAQMTPKISRMRPNVYLVQSEQFQPAWLKSAYDRLAVAIVGQRPEGYVALIVQDVSGQPRKLYPVKVFGD